MDKYTTAELLLNSKNITIGTVQSNGTIKPNTAVPMYKGKRFQHIFERKEIKHISDYEGNRQFQALITADEDIIKYYKMLADKFHKFCLEEGEKVFGEKIDEKKFEKMFDFENIIKPKITKNDREYPESFSIKFGAYNKKDQERKSIPADKSIDDLRFTVYDGANNNQKLAISLNTLLSEIPRGTRFNGFVAETFCKVQKKLYLQKYFTSLSINKPSGGGDEPPAATDESVGRERSKEATEPDFNINYEEDVKKEEEEETFEESEEDSPKLTKKITEKKSKKK